MGRSNGLDEDEFEDFVVLLARIWPRGTRFKEGARLINGQEPAKSEAAGLTATPGTSGRSF